METIPETTEAPPGSTASGCSVIVVENETCLLHSDIGVNNKGTAALAGYAKDEDGNEWELDTFVNVTWTRLTTGFGKCHCGGNMVSKVPLRHNARLRCSKCGTQMYLSSWLKSSPNAPDQRPGAQTNNLESANQQPK